MDQTVHSTLQIFHGLADLKAEKSTKAVRADGRRTKLQPIQTATLIRMNRFGAQDRRLCASFDCLS
ncbi:hypothetical protein PGR6_16590 [Pseudomonas sp. GR 6-02]|nr:hypothetical protein PGR6_16590 [Pseudomonas sp. GR 6-02]